MRNYTILENPFVYGVKHKFLKYTDTACGLHPTFGVIPLRGGELQLMEADINYLPLNQTEKAAYYTGRTIRFLISVPGAIIELALQIFASLLFTIELIPVHSMNFLNKIFNKKFSYNNYLTRLLIKISEMTTQNEPMCLAQDLRIVKPYEKAPNLTEKYANFLRSVKLTA